MALNGTKKRDSSIIYKTFLGHMRIYTRKIPPLELEESQRSELLHTVEYGETVTESPFLYLTCDLPPPPLFKDQFTENIIPQVSIMCPRILITISKNFDIQLQIINIISYFYLYR